VNSDRIAALEAIAYGDDPRISPDHRMRALEALQDLAPGDTVPAMYVEVARLSGDELDKELAGFFNPGAPVEVIVPRRVRKRRPKSESKRQTTKAKDVPAADARPTQESAPEQTGVVGKVVRLFSSTGEPLDPHRKDMTPAEHSQVIRAEIRERMTEERRRNLPPGIRQHVPPGMDPRAWERQWR
jgi:hypothetical protein